MTPTERRLAGTMDRDQAAYLRAGVRASNRVGSRVAAGVLRNFSAGRSPIPDLKTGLEAMAPLFAKAMVVGHMLGLRRADMLVKAGTKGRTGLRLEADPFATATEVLRTRTSLTQADLELLERIYGAEVALVLVRLTAAVERKVLAALDEAQARGMHIREAKEFLGKRLAAAGFTPRNSFTIEAIFRTQMQTAYSAAKWQGLQAPHVQAALWGYKYVTVGDDRVRPNHVALDGTTLPKDDPLWQTIWTPNGYACRCTIIPIFGEREAVQPGEGGQPDEGWAYNPGEALAVVGRAAA